MKQSGSKNGHPGHVVCRRCPWRVHNIIPAILLLAFSSPPAHAIGPYTGEGDTVVDRGTGLQWQKSDDATPRN